MGAVTINGQVVAPVARDVIERWHSEEVQGAVRGWPAEINGKPHQLVVVSGSHLALFTAENHTLIPWSQVMEITRNQVIAAVADGAMNLRLASSDCPSFWSECRKHLQKKVPVGSPDRPSAGEEMAPGPTSPANHLPPPSLTTAQTSGSAKFCSSCGTHLDEGAKFCDQCGHQVPSAGQSGTTPPGWYPDPQHPEGHRYWTGAEWTMTAEAQPPALTPENATNKPWNWAMAAFFALCGFFAGYYGWGALTTSGCAYVAFDSQTSSIERAFLCYPTKASALVEMPPGAPIFEQVPFGVFLGLASLVLWGIAWWFVGKARLSP